MDSRDLQGLMEAYSEVYAPQELTEEEVWEEVEHWVNSLLEQGYDLSDYTWEEMYNTYINEAVKGASPHAMEMRKGDAADRRKGIKPLSAKKGEEYAKYKMAQMAHSKRERMGEEVEQIDEISANLALTASQKADEMRRKASVAGDKETASKKAAQASRLYAGVGPRRAKERKKERVDEATAMAKRGYDEAPIRQKIAKSTGGGEAADRATALENQPTYGQKGKGAPDPAARQRLARAQRGDFRKTTSSGGSGSGYKSDDPKVKEKQAARGAQRGALTPKEKKQLNREDFNYLLEYLVTEGYASTNKEALVIMANMSEEWKQDIVEGMTMKDFKERRRKLQRKAASDDAKKRGHVDKFTGKPYGTEEAASRRKDIHSPEHEPEREARRKFAEDPY